MGSGETFRVYQTLKVFFLCLGAGGADGAEGLGLVDASGKADGGVGEWLVTLGAVGVG